MDQPTLKPTRKVAAASVSAAAGIVLVFLAGELGHPISPEVAAAVVTLLASVAGYFTREATPERGTVREAVSRSERKPTRRSQP